MLVRNVVSLNFHFQPLVIVYKKNVLNLIMKLPPDFVLNQTGSDLNGIELH